MSNFASFTSLPREIRDQIYKEVLVVSEPEQMFNTVHPHGHPIKAGHGLLQFAFSNQQIAREACEIYYGYNTFTADAVILSRFLVSEIDLGGGEWFFPAACVKKIIITITFFGNVMTSLDVDSRDLSFRCPKLRTIVLESFANGNSVIFIPRCARLTDVQKIVYLGRKLKREMNSIKLELYLHDFCYNRIHGSQQNVGTAGRCKPLDGNTDAIWLIDEPDQEIIEKVEDGQGSDREWLVVQMATKWAPIEKEHGAD